MAAEVASVVIARFPFKRRYAAARVVRQPEHDHSTHVFVKLQSSDGAVGWGEVPVDDLQAIHICNLLTRRILPRALGRDEIELRNVLVELAMLNEWSDPSFRLAFASFEMACIDLLARHLGVPAFTLLAGKRFERIPVAYTVSLTPPEWIYDQVSDLEQPSWLKVNLAGNVGEDLDRVEEVARLHPQAQLWLDAGGGFDSVSEALRFLEQAGGVGNVALCSSPLRGSNPFSLQRLKRASPLPIAADEECVVPQDVTLLAHLNAADMVIVDIPKLGGLSAALKISQVAIAHGFELVVRTRLSTQVGIACALQTFCGMHFRVGIEVDGLQFLSAPIASGVQMHKDNLIVSNQPGIGIEVDEAALGEFAIQTSEAR